MQPVAERARAISGIVRKIKKLSGDLQNNREQLEELVNTANAILLPRVWMGIDAEGMLHVTYVKRENTVKDQLFGSGPTELRFSADFIWSYTPWNQTVTCMKSRLGETGASFVCNAPAGVVT